MRRLFGSAGGAAAQLRIGERHAQKIAEGEYRPTRRHKVILREHCRAKLAARAFREAEAMRKLEAEDEALRQAIAWCESELK